MYYPHKNSHQQAYLQSVQEKEERVLASLAIFLFSLRTASNRLLLYNVQPYMLCNFCFFSRGNTSKCTDLKRKMNEYLELQIKKK